jgi:hypothetical protein
MEIIKRPDLYKCEVCGFIHTKKELAEYCEAYTLPPLTYGIGEEVLVKSIHNEWVIRTVIDIKIVHNTWVDTYDIKAKSLCAHKYLLSIDKKVCIDDCRAFSGVSLSDTIFPDNIIKNPIEWNANFEQYLRYNWPTMVKHNTPSGIAYISNPYVKVQREDFIAFILLPE